MSRCSSAGRRLARSQPRRRDEPVDREVRRARREAAVCDARAPASDRASVLLAPITANNSASPASSAYAQPAWEFRLHEATIDDVHRGIRTRQVSCKRIVQAYIDRAKAFNGVASMLVTADGKPVPAAPGVIRAGARADLPDRDDQLRPAFFPTSPIYVGQPIEFGRMESTASDPTVQQQFGMIVGIPEAGQLAAFSTLNIRGERSVTCKGELRQAGIVRLTAARRAAGLRSPAQVARCASRRAAELDAHVRQ